MWWFFKKRTVRREQQAKTHAVCVHHNNGSIDAVLRNVSPQLLKYIQSNLGRDVVYSQENITINLKEFCMLEIINQANAEIPNNQD